MKKTIETFFILMLALLLLSSCSTIKKNLPSAPSSDGVSGKNFLPSFDIEKRVKSYSDVNALLEFAESLSAEGHAFSAREMEAVDGRAAELMTSHLGDPLFPYTGTDEPYRKLSALFGYGMLPRVEKSLKEFTERYEKALWVDLRNIEDLDGIPDLLSKYGFLSRDAFSAVFASLYLREGGLEDAENLRSLIRDGYLVLDIRNKVFTLRDSAPGAYATRALLEESGYEEKAL